MKNFKGINRNVERVTGSTSAKEIERLQRKAMHKLYTFFPVIKRLDVSREGEIKTSYQVVGQMPLLDEAKLSRKVQKNFLVGVENEVGEITSTRRVAVGPTKNYRLYKDIVLVTYKSSEKFYETHRAGIEVEKERIIPIITSASLEKKSQVYFANWTEEQAFSKINRLTGGVLKSRLEALGLANYDNIASVASRNALCATTPSLWPKAGVTNSLFYFAGSIMSADEKSTIDVDNNFRDGYFIISDSCGAQMVSELTNELVTRAQARRMSYQIRVRRVAGKGHARAYDSAQILKEIKKMMAIDINKCHCWIEGKIIDLASLTEEDLKSIANKIDIIGDKDTFKAPNIKSLNKGGKVEIGIVNMSNETKGKMGNQIAFKISGKYPKEAATYIKALAMRQMVEMADTPRHVSFGKPKEEENAKSLNGSTWANCMAVNPERAELDVFLNNFRIKELNTAVIGKAAELKYEINSKYLRLVPEDHLLNDGIEVLGSKMVKLTSPDGNVYEVRALEMYSSSFNKDYLEMKAKLDSCPMTEEEKMEVLNNMQISTAIKSPSQGPDEFEMFYNVTLMEIMQRGATPESVQFFRETPNNCIVTAQDNIVKLLLAGSDFDGDDVTVIYPEFTQLESGKIVTGLIDENGERIQCYTCLCVRKRFEQGYGIAALIKYQDNTSVAKETKTEEIEEVELSKEFVNSLFV